MKQTINKNSKHILHLLPTYYSRELIVHALHLLLELINDLSGELNKQLLLLMTTER